MNEWEQYAADNIWTYEQNRENYKIKNFIICTLHPNIDEKCRMDGVEKCKQSLVGKPREMIPFEWTMWSWENIKWILEKLVVKA